MDRMLGRRPFTTVVALLSVAGVVFFLMTFQSSMGVTLGGRPGGAYNFYQGPPPPPPPPPPHAPGQEHSPSQEHKNNGGHSEESAAGSATPQHDPYSYSPSSGPHYKEYANLFTQSVYPLSKPDITRRRAKFHAPGALGSKYESNDAWRLEDSYHPTYPGNRWRPHVPKPSAFANSGEYLETPIAADYPAGADRVFLMVKTGGTEIWSRLPVHLFTTLTKFPHFGIYSDSPSSVGGYQVIDILANSSDAIMESDHFDLYRKQRHIHDNNFGLDYAEAGLSGGWALDKFKNLPMLEHAWSVSPDKDWYIFMDCDTYFLAENLLGYLETLNPKHELYLGSSAALGDLVFAHGGTGVVLSHGAMKKLFDGKINVAHRYEQYTTLSCCGDAMVAYALRDVGVHISSGNEYPYVGFKFQGNPVWDTVINEERYCQPIVSFHHINVRDIEILYEYEKLRKLHTSLPILYKDIYHDFGLPFIDWEVPEWDNASRDREYKGNLHEAAQTKEGCRKMCEEWDNCMQWRFIPNEATCYLSQDLRIGRGSPKWLHDDRAPVSGWLLDRIRIMRQRMKCDPLKDRDQQPEEEREGWFWRDMKANNLSGVPGAKLHATEDSSSSGSS